MQGWASAFTIIDELLRNHGAVSGDDCDLLLELRWLLRERTGAEAALRCFCELRRRLEQRHYLAFFRLRRWLEANVVVVVTLSANAEPRFVPLQLNRYCIEAVRRVCLCSALSGESALIAPRVVFAFRSSPPPLSTPE